MIIIRKTPFDNGAYGNQTYSGQTLPEGYYAVPIALEPAWHQFAPFVTLTIESGEITAIADNAEARAAQKAKDDAEREAAPPTIEEQLAQAQEQIAQLQAVVDTMLTGGAP